MATLKAIWEFCTAHEAVLSLLALAFIVTMREELPDSLGDLPDWLYGWLHDALKAFVSFRTPNQPTQKELDKQVPPVAVETTSEAPPAGPAA